MFGQVEEMISMEVPMSGLGPPPHQLQQLQQQAEYEAREDKKKRECKYLSLSKPVLRRNF